MHRIPFTKAVRDAGQIGLWSLRRIVTSLKDIDYNLVHSQPNRRKRRETLQESIKKKQCEVAYINAMGKDDLTIWQAIQIQDFH